MGEIVPHKRVSSKVMEVTVAPRHRGSILPELHSRPSLLVKIKKTVDYVRLLGLPGEFTSVTIEPIEGDREDFDTVSVRF